MSKLDALCAIKVMGYRIEDGWVKELKGDHWWELCEPHEWNPSTSLDDALVCLERAAQGRCWVLAKVLDGEYLAISGAHDKPFTEKAKSPTVAMCLAALRAMGVPESEIQEAMK